MNIEKPQASAQPYRKNHRPVLSPAEVLNLRFDFYRKKISQRELSKNYGIAEGTCQAILTGKMYRKVGGPIHTPTGFFTRDKRYRTRHFSKSAEAKTAGMIRAGVCPDRCSPFRWGEPVSFVWSTPESPSNKSCPFCAKKFERVSFHTWGSSFFELEE